MYVSFKLLVVVCLIDGSKAIPSHGHWRILNPGPFNIKYAGTKSVTALYSLMFIFREHTAIVIMASTAANVSLAMEAIAAMSRFYSTLCGTK